MRGRKVRRTRTKPELGPAILGWMWVDEVRFPVRRIYMAGGCVRFAGDATEVWDKLEPGEQTMRVTDLDGALVWIARNDLPRFEGPLGDGTCVIDCAVRVIGSRPGEEWAEREDAR